MDVNNATYRWETLEYHFGEKKPEWFVILGVLSFAGATAALLFGNYLFAVFLLLGAGVLSVSVLRKPRSLSYEINPEGIISGKTLYPYSSLSSFALTGGHLGNRLLLVSKRSFIPLIIIPLGEEDPEVIRDILSDFLNESEHVEPVLYQLAERLGL
ncbi:MAG: hypothetical protein AAB597_01540 [Patescibacteria group bacterium]